MPPITASHGNKPIPPQPQGVTMTKAYLLAVLERALKTAAQAALLVLGADQINAMHANWGDVGGFALGGFVLSLLTSLATSGISGNGPSATTEHVDRH